MEDQSRKGSRELEEQSLPFQLCALAAQQLCTLVVMLEDYKPPVAFLEKR